MPLYTYRCKDCDHEFDIRQRFSDDPVTVCPSCAGSLRRVISNVGIVFKGSGFYVTDNRNGTARGAANGKSESQTSSTSETVSETSSSRDSEAERRSSTTSASTTTQA